MADESRRLVLGRNKNASADKLRMKRKLKSLLGRPLFYFLRSTRGLRKDLNRLYAHALLSADLVTDLPASAVIEGKAYVYGTRNIHFGKNVLLYPDVHLETQGDASIEIGDNVVISRGVHLVAMAGIIIGADSMIGEYTSIRDANHDRDQDGLLRDKGYAAKPIAIGNKVWIGRGAAILSGVSIGDKSTVGANAVVTRSLPAECVAVGVPASPVLPKT